MTREVGRGARPRPAGPALVRAVLGALVIAVTVALGGLGPAPWASADGTTSVVAPTAPTAPTAPLVGLPGAAQPNVSPYPVAQRLGRWDGATFQPVGPRSIPAGHLVVMTHGWSPGFLGPYQRLQAQSPTLVTAWTPGLVDASNQSLMDTWVPVAKALQAGDPGATVVMYSWIDQSATGEDPLDARLGEDATEVNGHRLATAVDQALASDFVTTGGQVHLIGHSFGANVATTAALALHVPPRQLTLLDSPETTIAQLGGAKNDLRYKLPRLDIGRGPGQTFVDNYISYVGIRFAGYPGLDQVVDVQTAPPPNDSPGDKHSFAIVWYRTSAQDVGAGVGYAWSPLLGANDTALGSYYVQTSATDVLGLNETNGPPTAGVRTQLLVSTATLEVPGPDVVRDAPGAGATPGSPAAPAGTTARSITGAVPGSVPVAGNGVALRGGGVATLWNLTFSTDQTSLWLDVDVSLAGEPGDTLALFVDGRQRYQAAVPDAGTGAPGAFVILYDVQPGDHVLTVALTGSTPSSFAAASSAATLTGLHLSSTADIQRNLTSDETDVLLVVAIVIVIGVVIAIVATVVLLLRRLVRRRRAAAAQDDDGAGTLEAAAGTLEAVSPETAAEPGATEAPAPTPAGGDQAP